MPRFSLLWAGVLCLAIPAISQAGLQIGIVGDSTVCAYGPASLQHGWGEMLPGFFAPDVSFLNNARGGRSSKDFPPELWQQVLALKPDFVLIQFGHNDSHPKSQPEATDAATDYKENLRRYVTEARTAGATPILVTPPHRRTFTPSGQLTNELLPYAQAMREVGGDLNVPVVDLYAESETLFSALGDEGSAAYTMNDAGRAPEKNGQPAAFDRTHFTRTGAQAMARFVAEALAKADPRLRDAESSPRSP